MYCKHRNDELVELYSHTKYQGADPEKARFLFFGLDANFNACIDEWKHFPEIRSYLENGVHYWTDRGFHHPFLHPEYRGDGAKYHKQFSKIGFTREHAECVSFVELIDVPTCGRSHLEDDDMESSHMDRLKAWFDGPAKYIFIPRTVGHLLRRTPQFSGLRKEPIRHQGSLPVLYESPQKVVFDHFHFSCKGRHCPQDIKDRQLEDIGKLIW
jgi:hypothetical protein